MPRARSPNREKSYNLWIGSNKTKLLKDIAAELGVSETQIRKWKNQDQWDGLKSNVTKQLKSNVTNKKGSIRDKKNKDPDGTKATMQNEDLTHEQRLFCIYYSKSFNATQSYLKAYKCDYEAANANGSRLMVNDSIKAEIMRLKEIKRQQIVAGEEDLVEMHMKIAFSDIADYLSFGREEVPVMTMYGPLFIEGEDGKKKEITKEVNCVKFKESKEVDTQLIQEVKQGKDGASIKLLDKQKSLDWLEKHFLLNPMDNHKIAYDNKRLELEFKKIEPEDKKEGVKYTGIPSTMVSPAFSSVIFNIQDKEYNEYVFPGGRGSTKSSFIGLEVIDLIMKNPETHALACRQVADTLKGSVYNQLIWCITALGLDDEFRCTVSPLEITRKSTGQKIYFRGADDPGKIKSIKVPFGYIATLWFEELDQFTGPEAVRKIEQSVIRGGELAFIFKSFNPPKSANNWANKYIKIPKATRLIAHSTYLDVPKQWLGKPFIDEAEFLKSVNPTAYENEYMGVANGSGGNVFENVTIRAITDDEIRQFDRIYRGIDWGWYPDPYDYGAMHYDAARLTLYLFDEYRCNKKSNRETADVLLNEKHLTPNDKITCDSAEPKSVGDYKSYGLFARGAIKGPGSVEYGMKWLQSLVSIVIDNVRCPHSAEEFLDYEYERDKEGNVISGYPDAKNHSIDRTRYAMEEVWRRKGQ